MYITVGDYEAMSRRMGMELPVWPGENAEVERAINIVLKVGELAGQDVAQQLWLQLIVDKLDFTQMLRVGMCLLRSLTDTIFDGADTRFVELGELGTVAAVPTALESLDGARHQLARLSEDRSRVFSNAYQAKGRTAKIVISSLFLSPWAVSCAHAEDLRKQALTSACSLMYEMGLGAVGFVPFAIRASPPNGGCYLMYVRFSRDGTFEVYPGDSHRHGLPFCASAEGLEPVVISSSRGYQDTVRAYLRLTPAMTRDEITAAFSALTFEPYHGTL